jgi:hypothetical protein
MVNATLVRSGFNVGISLQGLGLGAQSGDLTSSHECILLNECLAAQRQ